MKTLGSCETFYALGQSRSSLNHRAGLDRSQTLLFPERLEDYVAAENPVRFLDAFVSSLDLFTLGFAKARCADTGRPPYDPAVLLKLYLLRLSAADSFLPPAAFTSLRRSTA